MRGGDAVETLRLAEFGDASLDQDRIVEVLAVLNSVCEANVSVQQSGSHGQVEALGGQ
jgi:hypothetical protein